MKYELIRSQVFLSFEIVSCFNIFLMSFFLLAASQRRLGSRKLPNPALLDASVWSLDIRLSCSRRRRALNDSKP